VSCDLAPPPQRRRRRHPPPPPPRNLPFVTLPIFMPMARRMQNVIDRESGLCEFNFFTLMNCTEF